MYTSRVLRKPEKTLQYESQKHRALMMLPRSIDMYTPIRPAISSPSSLSKPGQSSKLGLKCTS